jgi:hypothetical protein
MSSCQLGMYTIHNIYEPAPHVILSPSHIRNTSNTYIDILSVPHIYNTSNIRRGRLCHIDMGSNFLYNETQGGGVLQNQLIWYYIPLPTPHTPIHPPVGVSPLPPKCRICRKKGGQSPKQSVWVKKYLWNFFGKLGMYYI